MHKISIHSSVCKLTKEEWHEKHEDIVFYLQKMELPSTIDCIYNLAISNFSDVTDEEKINIIKEGIKIACQRKNSSEI